MAIGSRIGLNKRIDVSVDQLVQDINQLSSRSFIYTYAIAVKKKPDLYNRV